jgi:hypothetical protein
MQLAFTLKPCFRLAISEKNLIHRLLSETAYGFGTEVYHVWRDSWYIPPKEGIFLRALSFVV